MTEPIKSDVPLGLTEELTPEGEAWRKKLREGEAGYLQKEEMHVTPPFDFFCEEGIFKPAKMASIINEHYYIRTDIKTDELYFYYEDLYDKNGDMILRGLISQFLGENSTPARVKNTIYEIHNQTLGAIPESKLLALENGYFDVKTRKLIEPTPTEFVTIKCPVRYDENADCPNITKFLNEVLEADQVPIFLEFLGYCLVQEHKLNTNVVLLGDGANGKSTCLNVVTFLLGNENVSHSTLQQLCHGKFELAELKGKLANICDDLPSEGLKTVGNWKNLTGNAPIQARHIYGKPFDFLNTAKMWWACNKLPAASEDTTAYYRRFIILHFNKIFTGKKADTNLLEKLTTPEELSGLLNRALDASDRLLENGEFSNSTSIEETRQQYIRTADSCQSFIEEMTEPSESQADYVTYDDLFSRYIAFCSFHNLPKQRKANLTNAMALIRPEANLSQIRILNERPRVWQYLKVKELPEKTKKPVTPVTPVTKTLPLSSFEKSKNKEGKNPRDSRDGCDTFGELEE